MKRRLRRMPAARAIAVRLLAVGRRVDTASGWIMFPCYHDMRPGTERAFERQLRYMRSLGEFIGIDDAVRLLASPEPLDGRYFCMTFDDGCRGAYRHAHPIMSAAAVPAAFFIVPPWIDAGTARDEPGRMTWAECRNLSASGVVIGSHAMTHRRLADLADLAVVDELTASRARIEAVLGRPCLHFACPYGQPGEDYNPAREPGMARAAGYHSFLSTIRRPARAGTDPWTIPRVCLEPGWGLHELRYAFSR